MSARAPLYVVTGTGTGIGKTHLAASLLRALGARGPALGWKPVESGVTEGRGADAQRLDLASSFHVKHSAAPALPHVALREPVSPELAARRQGVTLDVAAWCAAAEAQRAGHPDVALVVELPGGAFSPAAPGLLAIDVAVRLAPTALVLAAPDRLGVLSEVLAITRAFATVDLRAPVAVVLVAPETADASTGTNAEELRRWLDGPWVVGPVPRAEEQTLARSPEVLALADALVRAQG